jgi:tetratricopeptide (TPR) repeat protein
MSLAYRFWLALNLHVAGRGKDAATGLHVALSRPPELNALTNCLRLLREHGSTQETALILLEQIDASDAHCQRGDVLFALERFEEAIVSYDRAIELDPQNVAAYANRGCAFGCSGDNEAAVASHDRALAIEPDHLLAALNRGVALHNLHRHEEALASFDRALAISPNDPGVHSNRATALGSLGRLDEALACYERAHALNPDFIDAYVNHGMLLKRLGRFDEALACFSRVLAVHPNDANVHLAVAEIRLALGDYADGWREYEWRWRVRAAAHRRDGPQLQWRGEDDLTGRTILLTGEQGFGDTLQFCRYAPLLERQAKVVLRVEPSLVRLLSTLPGKPQVVADIDPLPSVDVQCPLLSLPLALGTTLNSIPANVPYLHADTDAVAKWHQRLGEIPGLRVGLVWAGAPRPDEISAHAADRRRSITLQHYAPLGHIPGIALVSLQKGSPAEQTAAPPAGLTIHNWTEELEDFADTAALITALDLVISVDTAVVHLTGALGKPIWVLSRFDGCWRWLRDRTDSPWYPTARLFRQPTDGDWASVIAEIAAALQAMSNQRGDGHGRRRKGRISRSLSSRRRGTESMAGEATR